MKYIKRVDESYSISEAFAELNRPVQSKKQKIKESFTDNISDAKIIKTFSTFSEDFDKKLSVRELNEIPELPPHHNNINDFRMDWAASASLILRQFDNAVARTASNLLYIYGKAFKDEIDAVLFPARGGSASQKIADEIFAFWKRCWKLCRNHVATNYVFNESKPKRVVEDIYFTTCDELDAGDLPSLRADSKPGEYSKYGIDWVAVVANPEAGPFNSFDEIEFDSYDHDTGKPVPMPSIDKSTQSAFLAELNKCLNESKSSKRGKTVVENGRDPDNTPSDDYYVITTTEGGKRYYIRNDIDFKNPPEDAYKWFTHDLDKAQMFSSIQMAGEYFVERDLGSNVFAVDDKGRKVRYYDYVKTPYTCWLIDTGVIRESKAHRVAKRVVEGAKDSWQTSEVFYDLFKSKDPKICSRAANILYDWYSAEDAFSDFTSKRAFLSFVKSDLFDMFDAADSLAEVRAVIEALIGLRLKDFVIENLPEANKKITGYENPSATQIWDEADATLDDYSDYMIDKIIEITDCSDIIDSYVRGYIESIIDAELPDEEGSTVNNINENNSSHWLDIQNQIAIERDDINPFYDESAAGDYILELMGKVEAELDVEVVPSVQGGYGDVYIHLGDTYDNGGEPVGPFNFTKFSDEMIDLVLEADTEKAFIDAYKEDILAYIE